MYAQVILYINMYLCITLRNYRWLNITLVHHTWNQQSSTVTSASEIGWTPRSVFMWNLAQNRQQVCCSKPTVFDWLTSPSLMVKSSYIHNFCGLFMVFNHHFLWQNNIKQPFIDCFDHHFPWQTVETPTFFSPGEVPSRRRLDFHQPQATTALTSPGQDVAILLALRCYV